jgi:hypothetical protein
MDVYPNPVTNHTVKLDIQGLTNGAYEIMVLDMNGSPLLRQPVTGAQFVHTTLQLPQATAPGAYMLQLTDKAGNRIIERHIVVH